MDVKEKGAKDIEFKFNKHLLQESKYKEFLEVSDDEDAFGKPITKDGGDFALDFKIDILRDHIELKKPGQ